MSFHVRAIGILWTAYVCVAWYPLWLAAIVTIGGTLMLLTPQFAKYVESQSTWTQLMSMSMMPLWPLFFIISVIEHWRESRDIE